MTANDSKACFDYLIKLVDKYNNSYLHSIGRKPIDADYYALTGKFESIHKAPTFKVGDRGRITKFNNIFS